MGSATGDDLEITSIGALYRGQWHKKYWSSSRGKDRYPYPVGYHAIRTHAGSTYRMEIHEGLKGPIFVVTSTDGESCTGQTPDIAWESFQKKSCPRVKNWHGKRFSSKIDGVELFGFRNPFVQRLLRELVSNINGMAERSVLSHSCSRLPKLDDELIIQESRAHPNLLPYLEKQQITGKRSTKNRSSVKYPIKEARVKRICHQGLLNDAGGSTSKQRSGLSPSAKDSTIVHVQDENMSPLKDSAEIQVSSTPITKSITASVNNETLHPKCQNDDDGNEYTMSTKDCYGNEDQGLEVKASVVFKENSNCFVPVEKIVLEPEHSKCLVKERTISPKQSSVIRHGNSPLSCADNALLEKSSYAAREQGDSLFPPKDADNVDMDHMARYSGVCVADTCETTKDEAVSSPSRIEKGDLCSMQNDLVGGPVLTSSTYCAPSFQSSSMPEELPKNGKLDTLKSMNPLPEEVLNHVSCTAGNTILKELIKDSLPEVGSSSGSSNTSTEKIDLDLAGQELARSMMTFLLPRAVPLLKSTYVKRRSRHQSRETKNGPCSKSSYSISSELNKSDHLSDAKCQGRDTGKMLDQGPKENFEGKINVTRLFSGSDSLSQVNRLEHPSISCMTMELIPRNSKDVKSVIPDSFEEEQCEFDTATKCRSLSGVDIAAPDRIIDNISFSRLPGANSEGVKNVSNCLTGIDGCIGEVMLTDGPDKSEDWLSDSVLACVDPDECIALKQEPTDDCSEQIEKCTDNMPFLDPQVMHTDSEQLNAGCINNAEEEIRGQKDLMQHHPVKSENTESFEQYLPTINNLADSEVPKSNMILSHMIYSKGKEQSYSLHEQETCDDNAHTSFRYGDEKGVRATLKVGLDEKEETTMEGESMFCLPHEILPTDGLHFQRHKVGTIAHSPPSSKRNNTPLSEIIICRQKDTISTHMHFPQEVTGGLENGKEKSTGTEVDFKILFSDEVKINGLHHNLKTVGNVSAAERSMFPAPNASQNQDIMENDTEEMKSSKYVSFASSSKECVVAVAELSAPARSCIPLQEQVKDLSDDKKDHTHGVLPSSDMDLLMKSTSNNDSKDLSHSQMYQKSYLDGASSEKENSTTGINSMELLGCYLHPNPVLSILVTSKEDGLQICVMCGLVEVSIRNLFIYMVPTQDEGGDCPFFLGYTLLLLALPKDQSNGNIPFERSGLQFTPDGQSLVFTNSIKAPRCRQQDIDCSCKNCKSDYCEENTVEIVRVKFGYVSSVAKLTPAERVSCILVCEPNYLIAVGESGKLHVWIMNLEWSAHLEEFMLPNCHALSSTIFELKRIPSSNSIIGHNGLGDFGIWDISKRVILARFSSPGSTTFQILPLGLFNPHSMDNLATVSRMEEYIKEIIPMSDNCCPKTGEDPFLALSAKEMAVWFLVSAVLGSEVQHEREKPNMSPFGWWRLAFFMKNEVVMGSILDHRISAITASADYGIYGTCDGFLCKWELSTGEKVANIHPFKRGSISSIAVDPKSGALAVASDDGQLKVYLQPQSRI